MSSEPSVCLSEKVHGVEKQDWFCLHLEPEVLAHILRAKISGCFPLQVTIWRVSLVSGLTTSVNVRCYLPHPAAIKYKNFCR